MDGPARPSAGAVDGSAPARACPRPARLASHRGRRPPRADATADARAARPRPARRRPSPHRLHPYPRSRRRDRRAPHPRRARLGQKYGAAAADDAAKAALELQVPTYRFLRRYLERHPPRPAHAPASRPAHPSADALSRSHRSPDRRPPYESRRTRSRPAQAPPLRYGRRPRGAVAPGPIRKADPHRPGVGPGRR